MYALVFSAMTGRPLPAEVPAGWRERWTATGRDPLPKAYLDEPEDFPALSQAEEITHANAATVERARESVLPLIRKSGR